MTLAATRKRKLVSALVAWYSQQKRDLPWRRKRDPYAIWLSEIMLQQTRVETVVPYYHAFLKQFPTVAMLAAASEEQVLKRWAGLGYYRRARQLHLAAQEVVTHYGGELPRTAAELQQLKGVGRYTAGAIASIAFEEPVPLVDGNVSRVFSRLFALPDDMRQRAGQQRVWGLAEQLVPQKKPGDFNQALMELGALVCVPRNPRCLICPLRDQCEARTQGLEQQLPHMSKKAKPKQLAMVAAILQQRNGDVLLAQRASDGLFGGLWEPPMVEAASLAAGRDALSQLGVSRSRKLEPKGQVRHILTHRRLDIEVLSAQLSRRTKLPAVTGAYVQLRWTQPKDVPLSSLARKVLRCGTGRRHASA